MTYILIIAGLSLIFLFALLLFKKRVIWNVGLPFDVYDTLVLFLGLLSISFFLIYCGHKLGWYKNIDTQFFISFGLAIILGMFSLFSFIITKRIEKRIRQSVTNVAELVKEGYKILENPSTFYGIMVIYPYFGLIESVNKVIKPNKGGAESHTVHSINDIIKDLAKATKDSKKTLHLIVLEKDKRENFLKNIKRRSDAAPSDYLPNENNQIIKDRVKELCEEGAIVFETSVPNPFNMIISDTAVVWGSVNSETPGECKGFYSYDKDVIEAFRKYFDDIEKTLTRLDNCFG